MSFIWCCLEKLLFEYYKWVLNSIGCTLCTQTCQNKTSQNDMRDISCQWKVIKLLERFFWSKHDIESYFTHLDPTKGQKILKANYFKKRKNSLSWVEKMLRIVSFVCFLEELMWTYIAFEIYWPLISVYGL